MPRPLSCLHSQRSEQERIFKNAARVEAEVTASRAYGRSCTEINHSNATTINSGASSNVILIKSSTATIDNNDAIDPNSHSMPK
jgi:hypothetical protein